MELRKDQQALLAKPFEAHEHKFKGKNAYISKSAIRRRLYEVDPHWSLTPPEFLGIDGDTVIMRGGLTVCGITRYQIGTGIIQRKGANKADLEGYDLALMVAKAHKEAASAILSRAAVEFNIGAYLKDVDKGDKPEDAEGVKKLLQKLSHWGSAGGRERLSAMLKLLNLDWKTVSSKIEPGKTLESLLDSVLTEAEFMKRLVEIAMEASMKPAQPKSSTAQPTPTKIHCPLNLLESGDIFTQSYTPSNGGTVTKRLEVVENWGKVSHEFKLVLKDLGTGKTETVMWTDTDVTLVDGPKVRAYAVNSSLCVSRPSSLIPYWNGLIAEPLS